MIQKIKDKLCNTWFGYLFIYLISYIEFKVMNYYHNDKNLMNLMKEIIYEDRPFLLKPSELFLIYSFAKNQRDLDGDYAEVGVFKGATAKAICEAKGNKQLYLFDTFEGLPEVNKIDSKYKTKMFKSDFQKVKAKLSKYKKVYIYKGFFPETGNIIQDKKFAFVHLDVDIYKSTKDCLKFFYNKMSKGGIIISHDYNVRGVKKAFDNFFSNKSEQVIELPMSQCMIFKK
jgi:O-methyltransferase